LSVCDSDGGFPLAGEEMPSKSISRGVKPPTLRRNNLGAFPPPNAPQSCSLALTFLPFLTSLHRTFPSFLHPSSSTPHPPSPTLNTTLPCPTLALVRHLISYIKSTLKYMLQSRVPRKYCGDCRRSAGPYSDGPIIHAAPTPCA
jgi:hypothetical protein